MPIISSHLLDQLMGLEIKKKHLSLISGGQARYKSQFLLNVCCHLILGKEEKCNDPHIEVINLLYILH